MKSACYRAHSDTATDLYDPKNDLAIYNLNMFRSHCRGNINIFKDVWWVPVESLAENMLHVTFHEQINGLEIIRFLQNSASNKTIWKNITIDTLYANGVTSCEAGTVPASFQDKSER